MANEWANDVPVQEVHVYSEVLPSVTSKLFISNLHPDTNVDDLLAILMPLTATPIERPFVSNLRRGRRWAKVDVSCVFAQQLIDNFNRLSGVLNGQSRCEYAHSVEH